ncbi:MAG: bifunctional 4-hydroxy-2-oxoglutarate aldolase/2-dehydro-3-deoxy-phosphogluconate aldolase [Planctomycetes bacterium]|nr:bifunctional 4-hydroxy-2-oxoglutarate aldolase/2-dehydro-3-deoxy-phosphogluconate aldolase [Planctomycetota bacterium]
MTTNDASDVYRKLSELQIVPVLAIESVDQALPLADALIAGGLPVAEVTFRTKAAPDVIRRLAEERPQLLIGAGTVTSLDQVAVAKECGARFAMAPGLNPNVVRAAQKAGLPFVPGVMTPSDIEAAMELGLEVLKFFPAGAAGGPKMLKSISGPYAHLGTKFIPTGGITDRNMTDYLALDEVLAVGGTWIATKSDLAEGRWEEISKRCQAAIIGASQRS